MNCQKGEGQETTTRRKRKEQEAEDTSALVKVKSEGTRRRTGEREIFEELGEEITLAEQIQWMKDAYPAVRTIGGVEYTDRDDYLGSSLSKVPKKMYDEWVDDFFSTEDKMELTKRRLKESLAKGNAFDREMYMKTIRWEKEDQEKKRRKTNSSKDTKKKCKRNHNIESQH